jgi:hypothetical protein
MHPDDGRFGLFSGAEFDGFQEWQSGHSA